MGESGEESWQEAGILPVLLSFLLGGTGLQQALGSSGRSLRLGDVEGLGQSGGRTQPTGAAMVNAVCRPP